MKYYILEDEVYAFNSDGSQDDFIPKGAILMTPGEVDAHIRPAQAPEQVLSALSPVSHAQIIAALIGAGILTEAEGVDWITGTLPASVEVMIAALPAEQRTVARLRAIRPSSVVPTDPLVGALAASEGKSIEDLIAIFTAAAAL